MAGEATQGIARDAFEMAPCVIYGLRRLLAGYAPEGSKRRYPAHFTSKLTDADAELQETLHWLMRAKAYGYIDSKSFDELWNAAKLGGRRLGGMLKSGDWC